MMSTNSVKLAISWKLFQVLLLFVEIVTIEILFIFNTAFYLTHVHPFLFPAMSLLFCVVQECEEV